VNHPCRAARDPLKGAALVDRQSRIHGALGQGISREDDPQIFYRRMSMKKLFAFPSALITLPALAHDGHGLFGSHWHATDTLGFIGAAAVIALAVWFTRGGK
jgi:hypothetical protein